MHSSLRRRPFAPPRALLPAPPRPQISGDPVKLGLGLASMGFDAIFMAQHWVCYRATGAAICTPSVSQFGLGASGNPIPADEASAETGIEGNNALKTISTLGGSAVPASQQLRAPLLPADGC